MANLVRRIRDAVHSFRFPADYGGQVGAGSSGIDFIRNINQIRSELADAIALTDPSANSAVMACVGWVMDVWPEAPIGVYKTPRGGDRENAKLVESPAGKLGIRTLQDIFRKPCDEQSADQLWKSTAFALKIDGNAYWLKIRGNYKEVVGFRYVPYHLIYPWWPRGGEVYIQEYRYCPDGGAYDPIDPADVVHFRDGIDKRNTRKGISKLKSALTEIFTDDELARYTAAMAYNMGPAFGISPDAALWSGGKAGITITKEDAEETKSRLDRATRGSKRGGSVVSSLPWQYHQLGVDPSKMMVRESRFTPEERIAALTGISAGVAKLGAGLERNTFNNGQTEEEQSYRRGVMPVQRIVSDTLEQQVMSDFTDNPAYLIGFDHSKVRALQEDEDAKATRLNALWESDAITRFELLNGLNLPCDPVTDNIRRSEWLMTIGVDPTAVLKPKKNPTSTAPTNGKSHLLKV
jgi:phage portal protein BeeE